MISFILASAAAATVRLLLPTGMSAVPRTASWPFTLALPVRSSRPIATSATSLTHRRGATGWRAWGRRCRPTAARVEFGGDEGPGPPLMSWIGEQGHDPCGARVFVQQQAHENYFCFRSLAARSCKQRDHLSLLNVRKLSRGHREVCPHLRKIGDDIKLAFLSLAANQRTQIHAPFGDTACYWRTQFVAPQRGRRLVG